MDLVEERTLVMEKFDTDDLISLTRLVVAGVVVGSVLTAGWFFLAKYGIYFSCSLFDSEFKTRFTY